MLSIRTQDRMALVPYDGKIEIMGELDQNLVRLENKQVLIMEYTTLGTYATQKRALEVLDEIQYYMTQQSEIYRTLHSVYEMPKE